MGKGIKIHKARSIISGNQILLDDFEESDRNDIECLSCRAKLKYTKAHWRNKKRTWVASFFSLTPKSNHSEECIYNIDNAINATIRHSNLLEETLFEMEGFVEFRLHILTTAIKENKLKEQSIKPQSLSVTKSDQGLSSYLRTAKGLAKFWKMIQENSDKEILKDRIQLTHNNEKIKWNNFVFNKGDLFRLIKINPSYPVAMIVHTKNIKESNYDRSLPHCMQCYSEKHNDNTIIPTVYFKDDLFKDKLMLDREYLIIAQIIINPSSSFRYINIFLKNNSQFSILSKEKIYR